MRDDHVYCVEGSRGIKGFLRYDSCPENPREFYDHVGKMVCWHRKYDLGDEHQFDAPAQFFNWLVPDDKFAELEAAFDVEFESEEELFFERKYTAAQEAQWKKDNGSASKRFREQVNKAVLENAVVLPLYLYDHSGITISASSFDDPWDSGQVGYIYVMNDVAQREFPEENWKERAIQMLQGEVDEYDQYLRGDVYVLTVEREGEVVDSCSGYYGEEYAKEELAAAVKCEENRVAKEVEEALRV